MTRGDAVALVAAPGSHVEGAFRAQATALANGQEFLADRPTCAA